MINYIIIISIIGEFGDVYYGKLVNLTGELVEVAVKTLKKCDDKKERKNFEREMAISADPKMKHPNIVQVYGLVKGGEQWLVKNLSITVKDTEV